ncbi:MAG: hypothetical protein Q4A11_01540 [Brachymonas sp.]|nr:hypothetical protein [Brachymonas sp.]
MILIMTGALAEMKTSDAFFSAIKRNTRSILPIVAIAATFVTKSAIITDPFTYLLAACAAAGVFTTVAPCGVGQLFCHQRLFLPSQELPGPAAQSSAMKR